MTDEEYVYRSDLREKSEIAKSSRNKSGKHRRGCRLPADNMTKKERENLNGPLHTIKLGEAMAWEDFKAKPDTLQKQYIDAILAKYSVGPSALARMFGISKPYCSARLRQLGYSFEDKAKPSETARFLADFGIAEQPAGPAAIPVKEALGIEKVVLSFVGVFTPDAIAVKLQGLFPESQRVAITVEVAKVAEI